MHAYRRTRTCIDMFTCSRIVHVCTQTHIHIFLVHTRRKNFAYLCTIKCIHFRRLLSCQRPILPALWQKFHTITQKLGARRRRALALCCRAPIGYLRTYTQFLFIFSPLLLRAIRLPSHPYGFSEHPFPRFPPVAYRRQRCGLRMNRFNRC